MRLMLVALLVALVTTLSVATGAVPVLVPAPAMVVGVVPIAADEKEATKDSSSDASSELTLKKIFPEKGLFGPGARRAAFSHDGRFGAFLWRPYPERRHGSDLWIHDFETGETERITSATVMSRFQAETRKVRDDRVKKAKKRGAGKGKEKGKGRSGRRGAGAGGGDDPITGTWEGTVTGTEEDTMPPGGMAVVMELRLAADGSVSGVVKAATMATAALPRNARRCSLGTVVRAIMPLSWSAGIALIIATSAGSSFRSILAAASSRLLIRSALNSSSTAAFLTSTSMPRGMSPEP